MSTLEHTVHLEGLKISYRREGAGEPLLLLHGGFSDSREWGAQLTGLSAEFDVIAMDCLGCGRSDDPPPGYGLRDYAETIVRFLNALGVSHPHISGISFGSTYALILYRYWPALARSLVLVSAYAGWDGSLTAAEAKQRRTWLRNALDRPVNEWGTEFLATVFTDQVPAAVLEEAVTILHDVRASGFRPIAEAFLDADLREVLPLIAVPTLLLYGECDERSPITIARQLQAQIRDSRLQIVADAGHAVNAEAPDAFNAAVRTFLRDVQNTAVEAREID